MQTRAWNSNIGLQFQTTFLLYSVIQQCLKYKRRCENRDPAVQCVRLQRLHSVYSHQWARVRKFQRFPPFISNLLHVFLWGRSYRVSHRDRAVWRYRHHWSTAQLQVSVWFNDQLQSWGAWAVRIRRNRSRRRLAAADSCRPKALCIEYADVHNSTLTTIAANSDNTIWTPNRRIPRTSRSYRHVSASICSHTCALG